VADVGAQAKYLLETTFDRVANATISCITTSNTTLSFKAIVHDEIVRARREHLSADNQEGLIDKQSKRVILLTRDILAYDIEEIDAQWYFIIHNKRYDFTTNEPHSDTDTTPYAGADQVFSVFYMRRAEELESTGVVIEDDLTFDGWSLSTDG
jgi:hypothetical protein